MMQVIEQTFDESVAMYMKSTKQELAEMLAVRDTRAYSLDQRREYDREILEKRKIRDSGDWFTATTVGYVTPQTSNAAPGKNFLDMCKHYSHAMRPLGPIST